jgi:hypothetical protein
MTRKITTSDQFTASIFRKPTREAARYARIPEPSTEKPLTPNGGIVAVLVAQLLITSPEQLMLSRKNGS